MSSQVPRGRPETSSEQEVMCACMLREAQADLPTYTERSSAKLCGCCSTLLVTDADVLSFHMEVKPIYHAGWMQKVVAQNTKYSLIYSLRKFDPGDRQHTHADTYCPNLENAAVRTCLATHTGGNHKSVSIFWGGNWRSRFWGFQGDLHLKLPHLSVVNCTPSAMENPYVAWGADLGLLRQHNFVLRGS